MHIDLPMENPMQDSTKIDRCILKKCASCSKAFLKYQLVVYLPRSTISPSFKTKISSTFMIVDNR
uniref:Uncharacterized protein n=1 Tax=Romanomermis culicivorax TaxID=13658 RepID=A0A915HRH3_ROMCU